MAATKKSAKKSSVKTKTVKTAPVKKSSPKVEALPSSSLSVGSKAPAFSLPDSDGKNHSLKSYQGKKVVLFFYPKDATPGCTQEACDFRDNLARVSAKGAMVFGVSADTVESHRKFASKQSLNFPLLADPEKKVLQAYGVWKEKSLYGRKFMGIERTTVLIDMDGKVAKVWSKVKVNGHVSEVLAEL